MATNVLRNPKLDIESTFGETRFLGAEFKKHYVDGKDTGKMARLNLRVMSVANQGENLVVIPLVKTVEKDGEKAFEYLSSAKVEALTKKVESLKFEDVIRLVDAMALPRANKIDNQDASFIRAELDWTISAADFVAVKVTNNANA